MTKVFGLVAWLAVAVIAIFGIARGQSFDTRGAAVHLDRDRLDPGGAADVRAGDAVLGRSAAGRVKGGGEIARDVETLGGTTVINSDKTGTLTLNQMTATTMLAGGDWFQVEGGGYRKSGAILGVAGEELPDFRRLALGLTLCSDATVADDESIIGDPTEAALVVLAAKMSADAEQTRNALERRAEVPFDSEYKFMATFHDRPDWLAGGILDRAALHDRQGRARRRAGAAAARRSGTGSQIPIDEVRSGDPGRPTNSCPRRGYACSRSPHANSTIRRCRRRSTTRWRPCTISSSSRSSGSSTRCAPRRRTPSTSRSARGHRCPDDHRRSHRHRPCDRRRSSASAPAF